MISTQTYSTTSESPSSVDIDQHNGAQVASKTGAYKILDNPVHGPATIVLGPGASCPIQANWVRTWQ